MFALYIAKLINIFLKLSASFHRTVTTRRQ